MSGFSASKAQQDKVRHELSIVSRQPGCDPAHVWPRGRGGCDHPDCVIPLTRAEHDAFDAGRLSVLETMVARGMWAELAHPILCHKVSPLTLVERLTGRPHVPATRAA